MNTHKTIIFGTGPLGLSVMDALVERGYTNITLINRSGKAPETLPCGVRILSGDATNPDQVAALVAGTDVVFHCAQPHYYEWPEKFPPITKGILEGAIKAGVSKLIFGDNLYMYGPTDGKPVHENLPYAAEGHKGRTRAEMAKRLLDAHRAGKVKVAIGRASDFYGPRVQGSAVGDRVFPAILEGKAASTMGNVDLPHTYTYIKDFGRALVTLSEHDAAFGKAWHVPSAETLTTREFLNLAYEITGQKPKISSMGKLMLQIGGLFIPEAKEMVEIWYEFNEPYVVDHSPFAKAFGARPTPHREAIRETLDWYRNLN
ncbi:MAG TPA: SDR family oxidoreductase [Anaerolineales bacterium]|nr:SDR family oxidoreductase [Anaerolineales bacterium]